MCRIADRPIEKWEEHVYWVDMNSHLSPGYYWSDEAEQANGPYEDKRKAAEDLKRYVLEEL